MARRTSLGPTRDAFPAIARSVAQQKCGVESELGEESFASQ